MARGTRPLFYQGDVPTMDGLVMVDVEFVFGLDGWCCVGGWLDGGWGMGRPPAKIKAGKNHIDSFVQILAGRLIWTPL